jgi:hypothetical protein
MTDTSPPLWQVMRSAYAESSGAISISDLREPELPGPEREEFAVMLRALLRWLWEQGSLEEVVAAAPVLKLLESEADRAEAGGDTRAALATEPQDDPVLQFINECRPLPADMAEVLSPENRWRLYDGEAAEPQKPTEEELTKLVRVFQSAYNAKRAELRALPNPYRHDTESDMADHAGIRAVLALFPT